MFNFNLNDKLTANLSKAKTKLNRCHLTVTPVSIFSKHFRIFLKPLPHLHFEIRVVLNCFLGFL